MNLTNLMYEKFNVRENLVKTEIKEMHKFRRKSARQRASESGYRVDRDYAHGGGIKDSRVCFAVFVRAALDTNPQAGILGGGTQLGNNRCQ